MRKGTFKDLTGLTFGRLTVLKLYSSEERQWVRQKATVRFYLCRCICGKEKVFDGSRLTKEQRTFSCGCALKEYKNTLESRSKYFKEGSAFRRVLAQYKADAKRRSLSWELSEEEFSRLIEAPCHFTGKLPSTVMKVASGETLFYNGIDRLDSTEGYTTNNCVPCCTEVNLMKRNLPLEKFIDLCKQVAKRF